MNKKKQFGYSVMIESEVLLKSLLLIIGLMAWLVIAFAYKALSSYPVFITLLILAGLVSFPFVTYRGILCPLQGD